MLRSLHMYCTVYFYSIPVLFERGKHSKKCHISTWGCVSNAHSQKNKDKKYTCSFTQHPLIYKRSCTIYTITVLSYLGKENCCSMPFTKKYTSKIHFCPDLFIQTPSCSFCIFTPTTIDVVIILIQRVNVYVLAHIDLSHGVVDSCCELQRRIILRHTTLAQG